jgi:hypothetical protein
MATPKTDLTTADGVIAWARGVEPEWERSVNYGLPTRKKQWEARCAQDREEAEAIAKAMRDAQVQRTHWDRDALNAELARENKRLRDQARAEVRCCHGCPNCQGIGMREELVATRGERDAARNELAYVKERRIFETKALAERCETLESERDAALARVRELERHHVDSGCCTDRDAVTAENARLRAAWDELEQTSRMGGIVTPEYAETRLRAALKAKP